MQDFSSEADGSYPVGLFALFNQFTMSTMIKTGHHHNDDCTSLCGNWACTIVVSRQRAVDIDRLLAKAAAEQDAGKPWRAREVLSSAIPQAGFEPRLFLAFGQLLLELGEQHEAGKYLLLSGARQPEFDEAIALIVRRLGKPHAHRLYAAFPRVARLPMLSDYPQPLADELRALGLPEKLSPERPEWMSAANSPTPASPLMACLLLAILGTGFLLVLAVGLHRCVQLVEMWLKQH